MPRRAKPLAAQQIKGLPVGSYDDGDGLRLKVRPDGGAQWYSRQTLGGQRVEIPLGRARGNGMLTLAEARKRNLAIREKAKAGVGLQPNSVPQPKPAVHTFLEAARALYESRLASWRSGKHARQWWQSLQYYGVLRAFGDKDVAAITVDDVRGVLQPIWTTKTATATRLMQRIAATLQYAIASGWRSPPNPASWEETLQYLLPEPSKLTGPVKHFQTIKWTTAPALFDELLADGSDPALAVAWQLATAVRPGEALGAAWSEIDGDTWTIPPNRMKAGREHRVPLSAAARRVLERLPRGRPLLFGPLPVKRPRQVLQATKTAERNRNGRDVSLHGLRSAFRDFSAEATAFPREVCEAALAHQLEKTEGSYLREQYFERRRELMARWGEHLLQKETGEPAGLTRKFVTSRERTQHG